MGIELGSPRSIIGSANYPLRHVQLVMVRVGVSIRISLGTKFQLKLANKFRLSSNFNSFRHQISPKTDNFYFLDRICLKRVFPVENRKNKLQH